MPTLFYISLAHSKQKSQVFCRLGVIFETKKGITKNKAKSGQGLLSLNCCVVLLLKSHCYIYDILPQNC